VRYPLAFALQLRKKHGKTTVRVAGDLTQGFYVASAQSNCVDFIVRKDSDYFPM